LKFIVNFSKCEVKTGPSKIVRVTLSDLGLKVLCNDMKYYCYIL